MVMMMLKIHVIDSTWIMNFHHVNLLCFSHRSYNKTVYLKFAPFLFQFASGLPMLSVAQFNVVFYHFWVQFFFTRNLCNMMSNIWMKKMKHTHMDRRIRVFERVSSIFRSTIYTEPNDQKMITKKKECAHTSIRRSCFPSLSLNVHSILSIIYSSLFSAVICCLVGLHVKFTWTANMMSVFSSTSQLYGNRQSNWNEFSQTHSHKRSHHKELSHETIKKHVFYS